MQTELPTVRVHSCAGARRRAATNAAQVDSSSSLDFVDFLLMRLLEERHSPADEEDQPADLEFFPAICCYNSKPAKHKPKRQPPRLGRFTLVWTPWVRPDLQPLRDALMCTRRYDAASVGLAFLSFEVPAWRVSWRPGWADAQLQVDLAPPTGVATFQIPYPVFGRVPPPLVARQSLAALCASVTRANGRTWIGHSPLRQLLHRECSSHPGECLLPAGASDGLRRPKGQLWLPQPLADGNGTGALSGATAAVPSVTPASLMRLYSSAVFCLHPWGDTATRKGFWDAVAAGCVPVVFTSAGWNGTDAWFGEHTEWSVRVPLRVLEERGGLMRHLRAVPAARVRALQRRLRDVRDRVSYGGLDERRGGRERAGGPGALEVILGRLREHFIARAGV